MKKAVFLAILLGMIFIFGCGDDDVVTRVEEIEVVLYPDTTVTAYFNDSFEFTYYVWNTPNTAVTWYVNGVEGGSALLGTIDTSGVYTAPSAADTLFDEVWVKVVSDEDTTKSDSSHVIIKDRYFVYVDSAAGDDLLGKGTLANPYRTITKGLSMAIQGQVVRVAAGTYSDGEVFPLTPIFEVTVQGADTGLTFVQPPANGAAFSLQYERTTVKNLTIRGVNKQGTGVLFEGGEGIDSLYIKDLKIENCHSAAIKMGTSTVISFEDNVVDNCVFGLVTQNSGQYLILTGSSFTNIDSTAVNLINSITTLVDFNDVTIDGAWMGLYLAAESFAFIINSNFANIDSTAVYLGGIAQLENISHDGNNDFSGCSNWCLINTTPAPDSIFARGNTWPSADSATIDTQYIYDDDENENYGIVIFMDTPQ